MAEKIICLRPHHIDRFVGYYHQFENVFDDGHIRASEKMYGKKFIKKLRAFYDFLASDGTGEEYILVRSGLDDICSVCPIKRETCSEPDSLSVWNGSGIVMQNMDLKEGWLYPINEFLEKVKRLYQNRNP